MPEPEFTLGQSVGYEGEQWWIVGIHMKLGYGFSGWEYSIGRGVYGCYKPWSAKTDSKTVEHVRPDQLTTPQILHERKLAAAKVAVKEAEEQLENLKKEEQNLRTGG